MKKLITAAVCAATAGFSGAQSAHQHGIAQLQVAAYEDQLLVSLISPAANIVGFEHDIQNDEQHELVEAIEAKLNAEWLTVSGGQCELQAVELVSPFSHEGHDHDEEHHDEHHDQDHGEEQHHDEHHDEEHHDEHHDEEHHDGHHDQDHGEEQHHDEHQGEEHHDEEHHDEHHDEEHDHEAHADYEVHWTYTCDDVAEIQQISLSNWADLAGLETLSVEYLLPNAQGLQTLTADNTLFKVN